MSEQLMILQGFQGLGGQIVLIAAACGILVLGIIVLLLISGDRTRAKGHEFNSRRKLEHDLLKEADLSCSGGIETWGRAGFIQDSNDCTTA